MMNNKKTRIVVPVHPGKDVKSGLIRAIIKEAGLSKEELPLNRATQELDIGNFKLIFNKIKV
jgi:hypothetical protein